MRPGELFKLTFFVLTVSLVLGSQACDPKGVFIDNFGLAWDCAVHCPAIPECMDQCCPPDVTTVVKGKPKDVATSTSSNASRNASKSVAMAYIVGVLMLLQVVVFTAIAKCMFQWIFNRPAAATEAVDVENQRNVEEDEVPEYERLNYSVERQPHDGEGQNLLGGTIVEQASSDNGEIDFKAVCQETSL